MAKLQLGAFNCPCDGWVNTDITAHLFISRVPFLPEMMHAVSLLSDQRLREHRAGTFRKLTYLNLNKRWHFKSNSFEAVYSSHVLEHLPLATARQCLTEVYRCLVPGGVVRTALPDLDMFIGRYDRDKSFDWAVGLFEANEAGAKNQHKFMYNFQSFKKLAGEAGFDRIERCEFQRGKCPDIDQLDNRPDQSLYVECFK
jgi:SAM-dependent methyltransferase